MSACEAELCSNWTGAGCACEVFGQEPDLRLGCEINNHPDAGDGFCRCEAVEYDDTGCTDDCPEDCMADHRGEL